MEIIEFDSTGSEWNSVCAVRTGEDWKTSIHVYR